MRAGVVREVAGGTKGGTRIVTSNVLQRAGGSTLR